jgi:hypothetical protein
MVLIWNSTVTCTYRNVELIAIFDQINAPFRLQNQSNHHPIVSVLIWSDFSTKTMCFIMKIDLLLVRLIVKLMQYAMQFDYEYRLMLIEICRYYYDIL